MKLPIEKTKKPVQVKSKTGKVFTQMREAAKEEGKTKTPRFIYHVTFTDKVPKIQKEGVLLLQSTNWVKEGDKKRYGGGEVYAFEHPEDAVRWAAKMDWEFNKQMGSGKISVIQAKNDKTWKIDENDPMSQAGSEGSWLNSDEGISASDITKIVPIDLSITRQLSGMSGNKIKEIFSE